MNIREKIVDLVSTKLEGTENFLVDVKMSPSKIIISIDHPSGVKLEDCIAINRYLQNELENTDVFVKHELEVGSPGLTEPLKVIKQYLKRINQNVSVLTFDGMKRTGKLLSADDNQITLEEEISLKSGKQKEILKRIIDIPITQIKETKVNISFDKII